MDNNQIRQLLAKYFEGNTTLEEERILREYFTVVTEVDADLLPVKKQFELFHSGKANAFSTGAMESKIMDRIYSQEQQMQLPSRRIPLARLLIAASVALLIGVSAVIFYQLQHHKVNDTYTDPQLAYVETQKTLLYISQKMNKGIKPLSNISRMNIGTDKLKNLEKLDESLGMLNLVSFINQSSNLKK